MFQNVLHTYSQYLHPNNTVKRHRNFTQIIVKIHPNNTPK